MFAAAAGTLTIIFLLVFLVGVFVLRPGFRGALRSAFQDSTILTANEFNSLVSRGMPPEAALNTVSGKMNLVLPGAALVLADADGKITARSETCALTSTSLLAQPLPFLRSIIHEGTTIDLPSPCGDDLQYLSGTPIGENSYVLLFGSFPLLRELATLPGLLSNGLVLVPIPSLALVISGLCLILYYRSVRRQMTTLLGAIQRFSGGELSARGSVGLFREVNEITTAFNEMADEYQAKSLSILRDDDARRQMLTSLVHDVRTPLTALGGTAELLAANLDDAERKSRYSSVLETSLSAFTRLSESVQSLARLNQADNNLQMTSLDATSVGLNLHRELLPIAEMKGQRFTFEPHSVHSPLIANEELVKRALTNVLENAFRFSPENSEVRLILEELDSVIEFSVVDAGPGVKPEHFEKIFEEFYQTADEGKNNKGFGIGLAFVKRVMELHGGRVWCESSLERGTRFRLSFDGRLPLIHSSQTTDQAQFRARESEAGNVRTVDRSFLVISLLSMIVVAMRTDIPTLRWTLPFVVGTISTLFLLRNKHSISLPWPLIRFGLITLFALCAVLHRAPIPCAVASIPLGYLLFPCLYGVLGRSGFVMLALAYLFVYASDSNSGTVGLGMVLGLSFGIVPAVLDSLQIYRRIGMRIAAIGIFVIVLTVIFQNLALWFSIPGFLARVQRADASTILEKTSGWLETEACDGKLDVCLSYLHQWNPLNSYYLMNERGEIFAQGQRQFLNSAPENIHSQIISNRNGSGRSIFMIEMPGKFGNHMTGRIFSVTLAASCILQILLSAALLMLLGALLTKRLGSSFFELVSGIRRYRKGIYGERINLSTGGLLGETARLFDRLGVELPKLRNDLLDRAESRRRFIARLSQAMHRAAERLKRRTADARFNSDKRSVFRLSEEVHHQQRFLRLLLHSFRHENVSSGSSFETVPIKELLLEACESASTISVLEQERLVLIVPDDELFASGDPAEVVDAIQFFIIELLSGFDEGVLSVELKKSAEEVHVAMAVPGKSHQSESIESSRFLIDELPQVLSELGISLRYTLSDRNIIGVLLSLPTASTTR